MEKQTINLTLISDSKDLECKQSELHIEASIINGYSNNENISETLLNMNAECLFGLVKDFILTAIKNEKEKEEK